MTPSPVSLAKRRAQIAHHAQPTIVLSPCDVLHVLVGEHGLQPASAGAQPVRGASTAPRFHVHPYLPDVVIETISGEAQEFHATCWRHRWASRGCDRIADLPVCPVCDDGEAGQARYRDLLAQLAESNL